MSITIELAQKIIDYLQTRPYREVAALIAELVKASQQHQEEKPQ